MYILVKNQKLTRATRTASIARKFTQQPCIKFIILASGFSVATGLAKVQTSSRLQRDKNYKVKRIALLNSSQNPQDLKRSTSMKIMKMKK